MRDVTAVLLRGRGTAGGLWRPGGPGGGAAAAGAGGGPAGQRAISLHAVRSAGTCLDVLEATGAATRCRCVMHWFSGSSDELGRALRLGCSFSVGERMLATRRGREYARQLPAARLLLETDLPDGAGQGVGADGLLASLDRALTALAQARGVDKDELADCFREFAPFFGRCRFSGCAHYREPGCAVRQAVEDWQIARTRYDSYVSLYEAAKEKKEWG